MNKIIIGIVIGIICGFIIGYFITTNFLSETISREYARVTINNLSGHNITTLILKHSKGSIEMRNIQDKRSVNIIFNNIGENLYQIFSTFDNNFTVSSQGEYIEEGYRGTEIVYSDKIISKRDNRY